MANSRNKFNCFFHKSIKWFLVVVTFFSMLLLPLIVEFSLILNGLFNSSEFKTFSELSYPIHAPFFLTTSLLALCWYNFGKQKFSQSLFWGIVLILAWCIMITYFIYLISQFGDISILST